MGLFWSRLMTVLLFFWKTEYFEHTENRNSMDEKNIPQDISPKSNSAGAKCSVGGTIVPLKLFD